ncbi:MAG: SRPBCC domain-containing protein [Anaerolineae bacterium]|nr:SRPBCC domain-containing protein [Anaerolineae bacterium]
MTADVKTHDLVVTRTFDAPVEQVWKAWTDAEDVMQWWGPTGFTCPLARMDVREGGTSLLCMRAPESFGGQDFYSTWHYREIVPLVRIEYAHNLADADGNPVDPATLGMPPDFPQNQRHEIAFRALNDHQTELTVTEYEWTVGQMMEMSELGMNQCLDKMAALFAGD